MGILMRSIIVRGMRASPKYPKLWIPRRLTPNSGHRLQYYHRTPSVSLAKILCTDNIDPLCPEILVEKGHIADVKPTLAPKDLASIIAEYDGLIVRSATKVTSELLKSAPNLKVVGRAGVGIDNIDVESCTKAGVLVMNTPGGNTVSTAQLALSLLCTAARRVSEGNMSMKEGKWERKKFVGLELTGKTIGIVGCGRIGQQVGEWAKYVGMNVVGYDPVLSEEVFESAGIERMDLSDLWGVCDFITVHTPLTDDTRGIINDDTIARMKKGVIVVNCARGGIVDEAALLRGLERGQVGGAALDVYSCEPPHKDKVLQSLIMHERVVCTPHLGASTEEAQVNVARDVALQMSDTLTGVGYAGIVNVRYMSMAHESAIQPYMEIAEIIGRLQSQMTREENEKIFSVQIHTYGGTAISIESELARDVLGAQVLKGIMAFHPDNNTKATIINAPLLALENNISFTIDDKIHSKVVHSPYKNLISTKVSFSSGREQLICGGVFGNNGAIVQIDNYKDFPAFKPEGILLSFRNENVLSDAGINVGGMNVLRQNNDLALCLLDLDQLPSSETINGLRNLKTLQDVSLSILS